MLDARTRVCAFENTHIATSSSTLAEAGVNSIVQVATRVAWSNFVSPRHFDDDPIANGNVSEVTGRGETVRVFTTLLRDGQLFIALFSAHWPNDGDWAGIDMFRVDVSSGNR
jgi:hypothetical protein